MTQKIRLEDRECPLSSTLGIVGEWWTVLILHDVFDGYHRFDQFQANLGISSSMLTTRLKRLVDAGILTKQRYEDHPPRYEYVLTDLGRSVAPGAGRARGLGQQPPEPGCAQHGARRRRHRRRGRPGRRRPRHRPPTRRARLRVHRRTGRQRGLRRSLPRRHPATVTLIGRPSGRSFRPP